ncbi:PLP-dependent transferase [Streptomyces sp. NPDC056161]|uniref:PLP-dependent transferase n=1 Tax=Streptomyces sp. NPDC056161 TaxID=3345732 RepID=UPI0035DB6FF1
MIAPLDHLPQSFASDRAQFAAKAAQTYPRRSAGLGGVESLAVHPASMWRGMLSAEQIAGAVPPGLVRLAAGTEDTADLVADALAAADAVRT